MSKTFKWDGDSRSAEKALYTKGIIDIKWDKAHALLAVTYAPQVITIDAAMKHILAQTGGEIAPNDTNKEKNAQQMGRFRGK